MQTLFTLALGPTRPILVHPSNPTSCSAPAKQVYFLLHTEPVSSSGHLRVTWNVLPLAICVAGSCLSVLSFMLPPQCSPS